MVRRNAFRWTLATTVALLGARTVSAGPISFTGNVAADFNKAVNPDVAVVQVDPDPLNRIYQLPEMTSQGIINGYAIEDIREYYDKSSDTLYVGLNTYSIAGTAVGTGGAAMDQILMSHGGVDPAHIGGRKSITVGFAGINPNDTSKPGALIAVAGVPSDKSAAGPGIDGFTVAKYKGLTNQGIQNNYGATLTSNLGNLAFDPSAAHPGFEFTVKNFSKISPNLDPTQGFWLQAYAGSPDDNPIGEERTSFLKIPAPQGLITPEPATWLAWSLMAVGAGAYRFRRRGSK
jgi:hypothetical protein